MKKYIFALMLTLVLGSTGVGNAVLWDRGGGLIYDDALDITWLQDANYAKTSGYNSTGEMDWTEATLWANQLEYGGYDDWRLSDTLVDPASTNDFRPIEKTEMGHLFYNDLSGSPGLFSGATAIDGNGKQLSFFNLDALSYWTGSEYLSSFLDAWLFDFAVGSYSRDVKDNSGFMAWAVRDGDVTYPHAVPEPGVLFLMCCTFILLARIRIITKLQRSNELRICE